MLVGMEPCVVATKLCLRSKDNQGRKILSVLCFMLRNRPRAESGCTQNIYHKIYWLCNGNNTLFFCVCPDYSDNWDQSCPCCCWFKLNGMLHQWSIEANIEVKPIQISSHFRNKMLSLILWYLYHYLHKTENFLNVCSLPRKLLLLCVCMCLSDCYGKL